MAVDIRECLKGKRDSDLERSHQVLLSICLIVVARDERKDKTADTRTKLRLLYEENQKVAALVLAAGILGLRQQVPEFE